MIKDRIFWINLFLLLLIINPVIVEAEDILPIDGPGWFSQSIDPISPEKANAYYQSESANAKSQNKKGQTDTSLSISTLALTTMSIPVGTDPEIAALARGLMFNPKNIFDYVHNRIEYVPYFGALKGALLTHLDGKGNDFDQAALLVELLRASGYTAQYVYGEMRIPGEQLANWLGVEWLGASDGYLPIGRVLGNNAIPATIWSNDGTATVNRVWVKATIDGQEYLFDPAFKEHQFIDKIDLASAIGYDQQGLIDAAATGADIGSDYVQDLNEANLNEHLSTLTNNFLATIRSNYPNDDLGEIVGGRKIVETTLETYPTSLPYVEAETATWDDIPAEYIATLRIQFFGFDYTIDIPELSGQRLTLAVNDTFSSAELRLDGELVASGTDSSIVDCQLTIDHPYAPDNGAYLDQTATYNPKGNSTYAIVYSFVGLSDARMEQRQRKLEEYLDQSLADDSEAVLGETLNTMGLTWLKEIELSNKLLENIADVIAIKHHVVGFMAQEGGYYIDVKAAMTTTSDRGAGDDQLSSFKVSSLFSSAFEHGMLEQLMGSDKPGASTMKIMQLGNADGDKTFRVTSSNIEAVKPQLRNYSQARLDEFTSKVNSSAYYSYVLPENGEIALGEWAGSGYLELYFGESSSSMGMIISGDYFGGYVATPVPVESPVVSATVTSNVSNTQAISTARLQPMASHAPSLDTSKDPVDMASGAFLFNSTDLALGGGAPLGLAFSRSYDSGLNRKDRGLGYGWTHNYDIHLTETSHGDPALGNRQVADAAPYIVALYAARDLLKSGTDVQNWVVASLISKWGIDRTIDNAVSVQFGKTSMEFIKMPDGTFLSPPGTLHKLIDNGDDTYTLQERYGVTHDFDSDGRISKITDIDGNEMSFTYSGDQLQKVTDAFGRTLTLGYDGDSLTSVTDSAGRSVSYTIDADGDLTEYHDAENKLWQYAYADSSHPHRMTSLTNPENEVTASNTYDYLGQVDTQTVPRVAEDGTLYDVTYNLYFSSYRNVEEDPAGNGQVYFFDKKGRRYIAENALGLRTYREFDGQGHIVKATNHRGDSTQYYYDGNHNLTEVVNALSQSSKSYFESEFPYYLDYSEDALQHKTDVTYQDGKLVEVSVYPSQGETVTTRSTYYPNGLLWTTTDGRGTVAEITPDAYGFPDKTWVAEHSAVDYSYDSIGRMTDLTDQEGAKTSFVFDDRGLLQTKTDPLQKQTVYTYDDVGRVETKTDRNNHTLSYEYTPSSQLRKVTYPDASTVTFTHNDLDRLQYLDDAIGRTSYDYDELGRITSFTDPHGFTVAYSYDDSLNKVTLTYPGNKAVVYSYDELNRLKYVENWLGQTATYSYDAAGRLESFQNFNDTVTDYTFDAANRLTGLTATGSGGTIASYSFSSIDGNGNPIVTDQVEPLSPDIDSQAVGYTYNLQKNRLQQAGVQAFSYDDEGQLATGYGNDYTFDYEHRLVGVGSTVQYSYDGIGNRLQAVRDGATTRYIYDASGNLLAEADGNNTVTNYYIHGLGLMAMVTPADQLYCYHFNTIGSTVAMTDASQVVVNKYAYDPFGYNVAMDVQFEQPFKFIGQLGIMTEPNGFYYMRARYYDPQVGRFVAEDPSGFAGGDLNLYAYVGNNPIVLMDPSGLSSSYWGRVFDGSQYGAGVGAKAKVRVLGQEINLSIQDISGERVTPTSIKKFREASIKASIEILGVEASLKYDNGFTPDLNYNRKHWTVENLTEVSLGGTVPLPQTGLSQAGNAELHIHLNQIFNFD